MIRKSTWIILAVFALALAGLLLWQRNQDQIEAQATPDAGGADFLFDFGDATLAGIRIERVGDQVVELKRGDDQGWVVAWPQQPLLADSQALDASLGQLAALATLTRLEQAPNLADMGLEPPVYRLLLTLSDGRQLRAAVGEATPTDSGYYVQAGSQGVYVVSKYSLDPVLELVDGVPLLQPTETPESTPASGLETPPAPAPVGTP